MDSKIQELAEQVRYHADLYFNVGKPEISDAEFDALVSELKRLDPENPALSEIGANPTYGRKVKHPSQMGSLDKAKTVPELTKWWNDCGGGRLILMPKIDGLAVRLVYKDGRFVQAATRGDGTTGQDVTDNVRYIKDIPKDLGNTFTGELRGEIYMKKSVWEKQGEGANPRNAAAGSLLQKDPKVTGERNLSFLGYDIANSKGLWSHEQAKLEFLSAMQGVSVVDRQVFDALDKDLEAVLVRWENETRAKLDYEIDGMVLAIEDLDKQDELGWNGKCPRGKIAYKFHPEQRPAEIVKVDWFVGRQGKITPVAVITPTRLAGTTVTNVTLHNLANVKTLDIHVGDVVLVEKAGDIIPQIVRVLEKTQSTHPEDVVPTVCPCCKGDVKTDERRVNLWCLGENCPAKLVRKVLHYLETLEVMGVGEGLVEKLCEAGMVKSLPDLYYLDQQALEGVLGGKRIAEKTFLAIMEKNEIGLAAFLDALGIDGLGTTTSKLVAKKMKTLDNVVHALPEAFTEIEGIGFVTMKNIVEGLEAMRPVIDALTKAIEVKDVEDKTGPLAGMSFCLTGAMSRLRSVIEKDIEAAGGECKSCGRGLTFLVQADPASTSSKSEKAKKLGIKIISEVELYRMMGK